MFGLRGWFGIKLPGPKALGWSEQDALRLDRFSPHQEGPSWEDWHKHVSRHYPVRYFLLEVLPDIFYPIYSGSRDALYWLKCHLIRRHRYHLVDLRGVDPLDPYTHGYIDPCHVMELAGWAALRRWVELEKPTDPASFLTAEELAEPHHALFKQKHDEAMALYQYWMTERAEEAEEETRLCEALEALQAPKDRERYNALLSEFVDQNQATQERAEQMWIRLAAIRTYLWT